MTDLGRKSSNGSGRLEVVLDRSWEVQSVTWSKLTWWDPVPCGTELINLVTSTSATLPLPSPALSLLGQPPTPNRKLPPTHLSFRSSTSPSPIPPRYSTTDPPYSTTDPYSSSPLAWPLPPSPDSLNSVFLPNSSSSSPDYSPPITASSFSSQLSSSIQPTLPTHTSFLPTPPDSDGLPYEYPQQYHRQHQGQKTLSRKMFNFPLMPPPLNIPPPGLSYPENQIRYNPYLLHNLPPF